MVSAVRRNTPFDYLTMVGALFGQSMPAFWLGIMLILVFSVRLELLPSSGRGGLEHLILPALTLGLFTTARITRLDPLGHARGARPGLHPHRRAKGVSEPRVVWKHALQERVDPRSSPSSGIELGTLLGGAVITETIFAWPGVGRLACRPSSNRDYPWCRPPCSSPRWLRRVEPPGRPAVRLARSAHPVHLER